MSEMAYGSDVSHLSELISKETGLFLIINDITHSRYSTHSTHSRNPSVSTISGVSTVARGSLPFARVTVLDAGGARRPTETFSLRGEA
jgi:hypothetical protein